MINASNGQRLTKGPRRVSTTPTTPATRTFSPVDEIEIRSNYSVSPLVGRAASSVTTCDPNESRYHYQGVMPLRQPSPLTLYQHEETSNRDDISEAEDDLQHKRRKIAEIIPKHLDGCADRTDSSDDEEEKQEKNAPAKKTATGFTALSDEEEEEVQQEKKGPAKKITTTTTKAKKQAAKPKQAKVPKLPKPKLSAEEKNIRAKEAARLPFFLEGLTHGDLGQLVCADEAWHLPSGERKEAPACVGFLRDESPGEDNRFMGWVNLPYEKGGNLCDQDRQVVVDIRFMKLTQWRLLVKNLNISALQNKGKAQIRFGLGQAQIQGAAFDKGESQRAKAEKMRTSGFMRLVNAISAPSHVSDFLRSNDRKVRADHETGTTNKRYYQALSDRYNDTEEDNDDILLIQFAHVDNEIANEGPSFDLSKFSHKTTVEIRKIVRLLIKGRKKIKDNINVSGTHSSDPWEFSDVAVKHIGGLAAFELVYFFRFCEEHNDEIDSSFCIGGSAEMKGDSVSRVESKSSTSSTKKSNSSTSELTKAMDTHTQAMCEQLRERNHLVSKGMELDAAKNERALELDVAKNEKATFFKCLEHAKDKDLGTPLQKMAEKPAMMIGVKYGWDSPGDT